MGQDAQGHHLSGATEAAVADYDQAVRAFNLVHGDSVGLFERARAAAPEFAMAYLGPAWVFAVANGVEVAFVGDPSCQLVTGSLLVIRGKKPPDQRPCRR